MRPGWRVYVPGVTFLCVLGPRVTMPAPLAQTRTVCAVTEPANSPCPDPYTVPALNFPSPAHSRYSTSRLNQRFNQPGGCIRIETTQHPHPLLTVCLLPSTLKCVYCPPLHSIPTALCSSVCKLLSTPRCVSCPPLYNVPTALHSTVFKALLQSCFYHCKTA